MTTLNPQVLEALARAKVSGNQVTLVEQLDRKVYVGVNKVLETLGGFWNRKAKAHLFEEDPTLLIEPVVRSGSYTPPETYGYFPTPFALAEQLVDMAEVEPHHEVLEPSAGIGRIATMLNDRVARVDCVELQEKHCAVLRNLNLKGDVHCADFLTMRPDDAFGGPVGKRWDRAVMNPPFAKQQDIVHVLHALKFLKPGGRLVSVMSAGVRFRTIGLAPGFRDLVARRGSIIDLPPFSFRSSGTDVNTVVVTLQA